MEIGKTRREILERKSSIETEPMTLHLREMENAREEALYVIKTNTFEEALHIFTKEEEGEEEKRGSYVDSKIDEEGRLIFITSHGWEFV